MRTTGQHAPPVWSWHGPGAAITAAAVVAMVVASVVAWPDMAAEVVTREAAGRHGESVVPRGASAVLLPATATLLAVLLALGPWVEHHLGSLTPALQERSPERVRRVLGWTSAGLAVVLLVVHLGVLSLHTGVAFDWERTVGAAVGVLLVVVGAVLPLAAPGGRFRSVRAEAFRAAQGPAYRVAGVVVALAGVGTVVCAFAAPAAAVLVAVGGVLLGFGVVAVRATVAAVRPPGGAAGA
jgi:hypothetical protein